MRRAGTRELVIVYDPAGKTAHICPNYREALARYRELGRSGRFDPTAVAVANLPMLRRAAASGEIGGQQLGRLCEEIAAAEAVGGAA